MVNARCAGNVQVGVAQLARVASDMSCAGLTLQDQRCVVEALGIKFQRFKLLRIGPKAQIRPPRVGDEFNEVAKHAAVTAEVAEVRGKLGPAHVVLLQGPCRVY